MLFVDADTVKGLAVRWCLAPPPAAIVTTHLGFRGFRLEASQPVLLAVAPYCCSPVNSFLQRVAGTCHYTKQRLCFTL